MALTEVLDRLASFEPTSLPVISLYLNTQPDQHGRANFAPFVRKAKLRRKTAKTQSDLLPGAAKRTSAKKKSSKIHIAR